MVPGRRRRTETHTKGRLEAFSDGVFAIAITILVLVLSVPAGSEDDLLRAIIDQWPSYMAYLVSFTTIGIVWVKHSVITEMLRVTDAAFLRLNLALLLLVSFLPFPTKLIAEYLEASAGAERVAVVFYGAVLLLISLLLSALWRYAIEAGLVDTELAPEDRAEITSMLTPSLAFYAGMIVLGLFAPKLAVLGMLGVALLLGIPGGAIRRAMAHRR
jgi:uncharacterized membrane protein